jgi:hypothetical protein
LEQALKMVKKRRLIYFAYPSSNNALKLARSLNRLYDACIESKDEEIALSSYEECLRLYNSLQTTYDVAYALAALIYHRVTAHAVSFGKVELERPDSIPRMKEIIHVFKTHNKSPSFIVLAYLSLYSRQKILGLFDCALETAMEYREHILNNDFSAFKYSFLSPEYLLKDIQDSAHN